jgi:hypothetical protein
VESLSWSEAAKAVHRALVAATREYKSGARSISKAGHPRQVGAAAAS